MYTEGLMLGVIKEQEDALETPRLEARRNLILPRHLLINIRLSARLLKF